MPRVSQTPSGAVVAEDVRDLQRWPGHPTALRRRSFIRLVLTAPHFPLRLRQLRERALDGRDHAGGHARVTRRRLKFVVSEQSLDNSDVSTAFEQMGCEGMAKRMKRQRFCAAPPLSPPP